MQKVLDQVPKGALSSETLSNKDGAEALVISAYALLDQVLATAGRLLQPFLILQATGAIAMFVPVMHTKEGVVPGI